jgi:hypothetical protein
MIDKILDAIKAADLNGAKTVADEKILTGYSGLKIIGMLQRLASLYTGEENSCYLEVGVFQGLTLLSVAHSNPEIECYGVDNFAQFDVDNKNQSLILQRMRALKVENANLLNFDYEDAFDLLPGLVRGHKLGTYFIDGPHDYRSQYMCLVLAAPNLHSRAVIVIDDANYPHVRQANRDFLITHPEYKLVFEAYTPQHPLILPPEQRGTLSDGWWNGVNVIARDPDNVLPPMYPPTDRNRLLFENEHILRSSMFYRNFPEINSRITEVVTSEAKRFPRLAWRFVKWMWRHRPDQTSILHPSMNTFSEDLPGSNFNTLR